MIVLKEEKECFYTSLTLPLEKRRSWDLLRERFIAKEQLRNGSETIIDCTFFTTTMLTLFAFIEPIVLQY